ncbi:FHA domain-containing protein [Microbacterium sp. NPDC089318]
MNQFSYQPGAWQLVVENGGVVAVPGEVDAERIESLHRMLRDGNPQLTDVIDVLADGSISALGSFAVALTSAESIRFAVRGPVQARIGADGDEIVSGAQVSTWTERFIADAQEFELTVDEASTDTWYPIESGVVLGAVLRHGTAAAASPDRAAVPDAVSQPTEPSGVAAVEPEPEPEPEREPEPASVASAPESSADEPAAVDSQTEGESEAVRDSEVDGESAIDHTLIPADLTLVPEPDPAAGILHADLSDSDERGDHDGSTISLAEMRRLRAQQGLTTEPQTAGPEAPTAVLPVVDALAGSSGHGVARLSTGQVVELDRTVIIGRRPRSTRTSGENMPHLVAVDSPQQDISRSHLEIRPEGDSVVVIDLRTTNGSTLLRPGADPVRLHPGEHTLVLSGDVVDLGDGVTVAFEGLV